MTANHSIDPARFLSEYLEHAEPDLLRSMLTTFIDALMSAEADALSGASHGARTRDRVYSRTGSCSRSTSSLSAIHSPAYCTRTRRRSGSANRSGSVSGRESGTCLRPWRPSGPCCHDSPMAVSSLW